jgi:hypothetical protein
LEPKTLDAKDSAQILKTKEAQDIRTQDTRAQRHYYGTSTVDIHSNFNAIVLKIMFSGHIKVSDYESEIGKVISVETE